MGILRDLRSQIKALLYPELPGLVAENAAESDVEVVDRRDAANEGLARIFGKIAVVMANLYPAREQEGRVRLLGNDVSSFNKVEVSRQLKAAIGVDVVTSETFLPAVLENFVADQVGRVKSLTDDQLPILQSIVRNGFRRGGNVRDIKREIERSLGVSESKAALIARDQIGKLNGELTRKRQKAAGIKKYTWSTSQDERVRAGHKRLNGKTFRWDKPPIVDLRTGRRGHPGDDFQCRCAAIPVIA